MLAALVLASTAPARGQDAADATAFSLERLLDITVVGASKYEQKQKDVAAAVSVITHQEIKAFGWRTLADALASLPGVYTTYDRQYTYLGTRGFGLPGDFNTRLLLTIDGNRVNDGVFDQAYLGREFPLDIDLVERIEFIPGPGSAVYGQNAMFAVVNVVTRRGADVHGAEVSATYQAPQAFAKGRVSWGARLDNGIDALVSASGLDAGGEDRLVDFGAARVSGIAAGLDGERDRELFASLSRGHWSSILSYGDRVKDDPLGTYLSDPLTKGQHQQDTHLLTQLQYQNAFADDAVRLSGRAFLGQERYRAPFTFSGAPTLQTGSSNWTGADLSVLSTPRSGHKLLTGLEYQANTRQDQSYEDVTAPATDVTIPGSSWRAGVYAQDEWALRKTISATIGVRFDHKDGARSMSPRAGLIWNATPTTVWKALYGRAHRSPNVFERDFSYLNQVANPALDGETIDTLELVVDHRLENGLSLRASAYSWTMEHLVTLGTDAVSGLAQYQNGGNITARGLELSAAQAWGSGARVRGSVSYQHSRNASGGSLLNSPALLGKLNASGPLFETGLRLAYELLYDSERDALGNTHV
ncbi:MAG: TonB-dependent receptor, partial [Acidobacteriota bacterium]